MPRLLAAALTAFASSALLLLPAAEASAAPTPTISPSTVPAGGSFTVSGTGCWDPAHDPSVDELEPLWVAIVSTAWGSGSFETTDSPGGAWSVTIQLPPTAHSGSGSVEVLCSLSTAPGFSYPKQRVTVPPPGGQPRPPGAVPPPQTPSPAPGRSSAPAAPSAPRGPAGPPPVTAPTPDAPVPTTAAAGPAPDCADCGRLSAGESLGPGDVLRLGYTGFRPGEQVTVVLRSTPVTLGAFTADGAGTVTAEVTLPSDAAAGSHTLTFSGALSGDLVVLPLELDAAAAAAPSARATRPTGSPGSTALRSLSAGAAALLLAAGVLALVERRRTARHRAAGSGDGDADRRTDEVGEPGSRRAEEQLA